MMKIRRILSLILTLALLTALCAVSAHAEGEQPVSLARAGDSVAYDGETLYLPIDGELYVSFEIEGVDGLIAGWRNDLFTAEGFGLDDDPTIGTDGTVYAHITPGDKEVGESAVLYYNWYRLTDIFGDEAVGWIDAVPVYSATVVIEVTEGAPARVLGDADGDGEVSILDATAIQRHLAKLSTSGFVMLTADTDRDGGIDILDATRVQRWLAKFQDGTKIGEEVTYGTYYAMWNIEGELLPEGSGLSGDEAEAAREEIRYALNLLVDRNADIFTGRGNLPAATFVSKWITDADGTEFAANAGDYVAFSGYYDTAADSYDGNLSIAVNILKKYYAYDEASNKFTNVPSLTYIYNEGTVHGQIAEQISADFARVGVELKTESKEWDTYYQTMEEGGYALARSGWVVDYDDPMEFLTMWTSDSEDNSIGFGRGAHKDAAIYSLSLGEYGIDVAVAQGTWAQTYDVLIEEIKKCEDRAAAYSMMHLAEDMLMGTGCVMPLYYY